MPCALLALTASLLLAAPPHGRLDVGLHAAAQARSAPGGPGAGGGLVLVPRLKGLLEAGPGELEASYAPQVLLGPALAPGSAGVRHLLRLSGGWGPRRNVRLSSLLQARYGPLDFLSPGAGEPPSELLELDEAQLPLLADHLRLDAVAGGRWEVSHRLSLTSFLLYSQWGGSSPASRRLLPRQHAPALVGNMEYALTRNDMLAGEFYAGATSTPESGSTSTLLQLSSRWERLLSRVTTLTLSAGAGMAREEVDASTPRDTWRLLPRLGARLRHEMGGRAWRLEWQGEGKLEPFVNPYDGALTHRAEASLAVMGRLGERLGLRWRASAAMDVAGEASQGALAAMDAEVGWRLNGRLRLGAGARSLWRQEPLPGTGSPWQWTAFTSLTFDAWKVL